LLTYLGLPAVAMAETGQQYAFLPRTEMSPADLRWQPGDGEMGEPTWLVQPTGAAAQRTNTSLEQVNGTLDDVLTSLAMPVRSESFYGHDANGPYFLQAKGIQLVSEVVVVNSRRLTRDKDYQLDYATGELTFMGAKPLTPNDFVMVTYQEGEPQAGRRLFELQASVPVSDQVSVGFGPVGARGQGETAEREVQDQFTGKNLAGPFYLTNRMIVPESEVVTVNGVPLQRDRTYRLDAASGSLQFINGYLPPVGASVQVRYRVPEFTAPDAPTTTGVEVNWKNDGGLAFNMQMAKSEASPARPQMRSTPVEEDAFEELRLRADLPPSQQALRLSKWPVIDGTEVVRIAARDLVRGQDYSVNYQTGELRLLHDALPVAGGTPLVINYRARPAARLQQEEGQAMTATASYNSEKIAASAQIRDVDEGFALANPQGITSEQRSLNWFTSYAPSPSVTMSMTGDTRRRPSYAMPGLQGDDQEVLEQNRTYMVDIHKENLPTLTLQRMTASSQPDGEEGVGDSMVRDSVTSSWSKGPVTASVNLDRIKSESRQPRYQYDVQGFQTIGAPVATETESRNSAFNIIYQPSDRVNVGLHLGATKALTNSEGFVTTSGGTNMQANATFKPSDKMSYTATWARNVTQPVESNAQITVPQQQNENISLGASWQPSRTLDVNVNLTQDRAASDVMLIPYTNEAGDGFAEMEIPGWSSTSRGTSVNVNYHPDAKLNIGVSAGANASLTENAGIVSTTSGNSVQAYATYQPSQDVTLNGSMHTFTSTNGTDVPGMEEQQQRSSNLSLNANWRANEHIDANVRYNVDSFGSNFDRFATKTVGGDVTYRDGDASVTLGMASQQIENAFAEGPTRGNMVSVSGEFSPVKNTTVSLHAERAWSKNGGDVGQLVSMASSGANATLNAIADPYNEAASLTQNLGYTGVSGDKYTSVGGKVTYRLNDIHDVSLSGEVLRGSGPYGDTSRRYLGLGWHYQADEDLQFSLDARRVWASESVGYTADTPSTEINAELKWRY
jgi:hypothetical protein